MRCCRRFVGLQTKEMRITHNALQGVRDQLDSFLEISPNKLQGLMRTGGVLYCLQLFGDQYTSDISVEVQLMASIQPEDPVDTPQPVQQLLLQFKHLFVAPTQLPPQRPADHQIPLVHGAQPVKVCPYHYSPIQKTEVENQVKQMLSNGVIKPRNSAFTSLVLLVRKKDGTWHFCVDYHHLNAIIVKHKHPMPVVDELLDELSGAQWFTKLDFSAGYHQIRMASGDEFKTTFRTHQGLYEFMYYAGVCWYSWTTS